MKRLIIIITIGILPVIGCRKGIETSVNPKKELDSKSSIAGVMGSTVVNISYSPISGSLFVFWDDDFGQFTAPYTVTISGGGGPIQTIHTSSMSININYFYTSGTTLTVVVQASDFSSSSASIIIDGSGNPTPEELPWIDCAVTAAYPYTHISYHFTWDNTPALGMADTIFFYIENKDYYPPQMTSGAGRSAFSTGSFTIDVPRLARAYGSNRDLIFLSVDSRPVTTKYPGFEPQITYEYTIPGLDYFGHWTLFDY